MDSSQPSNQSASPITSVDLYRLAQPLREPYHLSFGTFEAFDLFLARVITQEGEVGWGETTACAGYVSETGDEIWDFLRSHASELIGTTVGAAVSALTPCTHTQPFATTPLLTALESLAGVNGISGRLMKEGVMPLVGILSSENEAEMERGFWAQVEKGHSTIKLKVGFDAERDIQRAAFVQGLARQAAGVRIRVDANQGYSLDEAMRFVKGLDPEVIELFEQPFDPGEWDSQEKLAPFAPVPLMLDESIHGAEEVRRTAATGCAQYVKFKLMKSGSAKRLAEEIELARGLGLRVVVGNGVAGEVGCYQEAAVALAAGVETAGEMNGFLKMRQPLLAEPLGVQRGGVIIRPQFQLEPAAERLSSMAVAHLAFP